MNFKRHIPIIILLLCFQFFISDIFGAIYLPLIERQLTKERQGGGEFYRSNEYKPRSEEGPREFAFVYVSKSADKTIETYYSRKGNRTIVTYKGGKWQSSETEFFPTQAFLVLPFLGFCLGMFAILHKMVRTRALTTWTLSKYPFDNIERFCLLYGIPLFASAILFGWIGRI